MKYWDWYLKIAVGSALIGGSMEYFMIKSGFCILSTKAAIREGPYHFVSGEPQKVHNHVKYHPCTSSTFKFSFRFDDKVTVLESEKRAWDNSPEAQAIRDALNPWKNHDNKAGKDS